MTDLSNVFNYAMPNAKSSLSAGTSDLGAAGGYFKQLLSGNRASLQQATAPETNAARAGSDAQARQQASMGTARGGGTNATNQTRQDDLMAKVDNAMFGARAGAAKGLEDVGAKEAGIGANLLNTGTTAITNMTDTALSARSADYKINQDMVGKVTGAIDTALSMAFG